MARIMVGHTIKDTDADGNDFEFVVTDMNKMMSTPISIGDEIFIPVSVKNGQAAFWESGGRDQKTSSIGVIIAGDEDQLLDAFLFNKLSKTPNGKHALIGLRTGYRMYVGKITIDNNALTPKLKVIRLVYHSTENEHTNDKVSYGRFVVNGLFTDYKNIKGCFPAERLIGKLFVKDVMKPHYANGWSVSNIINIKNHKILADEYLRLSLIDTKVETFEDGDHFLDTVENAIVNLNNKKLSAVLQCIDFETMTMTMKPMIGMSLSDIVGTIKDATVNDTFIIPIEDMVSCYNKNIMINPNDIDMLEVALSHDDTYSINIGNRKFVMIRAYFG